jgi:hypothetical protein
MNRTTRKAQGGHSWPRAFGGVTTLASVYQSGSAVTSSFAVAPGELRLMTLTSKPIPGLLALQNPLKAGSSSILRAGVWNLSVLSLVEDFAELASEFGLKERL